jgi:hypothetical protein
MNEDQRQVNKLLALWSKSIIAFVSALDVIPTDQQLRILKNIDNGYRDVTIKSGHGTGKTALLSWVILWVGLTKEDAKIPTTAPTNPQLTRLLLPEVKKWREKLPPPLKEQVVVMSDEVRFSNGNFCIARTARAGNEEALQGFHASFLCWIVDEASGIGDKIFEVIDGSLTGANYLRIMTSNPTRTVGYFYDSHNKNRKLWKTHTLSSVNSPNVAKESIERKKQQYGENTDEYRVRVLGEFPLSNTDALFTAEEIDKAMNRQQSEVDRSGVFIYGVDVARYGSDNSVITKRRGQDIYSIQAYKGYNTLELANKIQAEAEGETEYPTKIFIDTIGVGAGVYDNLQGRGYDVEEGNVSFKADDAIYSNKRAEIYFNLLRFVRSNGRIPKDDELREELLILTYSYNDANGKIKLMKKEEIKEELGRSPDKSDSVALTLFRSVKPKQIERVFNFTANRSGWAS